MEGGWLHSIQTLTLSALSGLDRLVIEKIEECRTTAKKERLQEEAHLKATDYLRSKKEELTRIADLVQLLTPEINSLRQEEKELELRLNAVNSELTQCYLQNETTLKKIEALTEEVVIMEQDKENQVRRMKKEFGDLKKVRRVYKVMFDMQIEWLEPDTYNIWFSSITKGNLPDLVLRTTDFSAWDVLYVHGNDNLKDELNDDFVDHRNIQRVLLKAKQLYGTTAI